METSYERTTTTKTYNVTHSVPPHSLVITRTGSSAFGASQGGSGGKTITRKIETSSGGDASFDPGQYVEMTATNVQGVKDARDKERSDMKDLNERFANYIDRVTSCFR